MLQDSSLPGLQPSLHQKVGPACFYLIRTHITPVLTSILKLCTFVVRAMLCLVTHGLCPQGYKTNTPAQECHKHAVKHIQYMHLGELGEPAHKCVHTEVTSSLRTAGPL